MDFAKIILGEPLKDKKNIVHTYNKELWYKIQSSSRSMYVPPIEVLKANALELDKFVEAVQSFDKFSIEDLCDFDWSDDYVEDITVDSNSAITFLTNYSGEKMEVSCDIETRHVHYNDNAVLAVGFCWRLSDGRERVATVEGAPKELQKVFDNKNLHFIWHNGKFDITRLSWLAGISARVDADTMLMHYIGINEKKGTHSLKDLGQVYLQAPAWDDELQDYKKDWCRKNRVRIGDFTYDMIPVSTLIPYLKRDVLATLRLKYLFEELMRPESVWMYKKLVEASNTYAKIELNGVLLNREHLEKLKVELKLEETSAMEVADRIIRDYWDPMLYCSETGAHYSKKLEEFNMGSPKQLKWMISRLVGFPVNKTDKATLEELSEHMEKIQNEDGKKFISSITAARKASKYYDTYCCNLEELCCDDGRVRCSYNLHGTETGRLSSTDPNMQNIPRNKRIKKLIACDEGNILVQLDYSQAELRTLAALSGDPYLIHIYESGADLHDMMATKMFGPGFTKEQRVITKSLNFGIAYGRGPKSIAQMFKLSMSEAKKTVSDWFAAVPEVEKFIKRKRKEPFSGEVCKTPFGRERHFVITNENRYHVSNEAINFPIQSIASDLTLLSVLELQRWIESSGHSDVAKIVATVHDSIVIEVKNDKELVREVATKGAEIMANQPKKFNIGVAEVPFRADAEVGPTWGEVEEYAP